MAAYIDSSVVVAILLEESGFRALHQLVDSATDLRASPLLESEVRSRLAREARDLDPAPFVDQLTWIVPADSARDELQRVLAHGYIRGADLWHLACALVAFGEGEGHDFYSVDRRQREVAAALGFRLFPASLD